MSPERDPRNRFELTADIPIEVKNLQLAQRKLYEALDFGVGEIETPECAPSVVDFARFWKRIGIPDGCRGRKIVFPLRSEVYVGADYKPRKQVIEVAEYTKGKELEVTPKRNHLVEIHNEPNDPNFAMTRLELYDNLPDPHHGDMVDFLTDKAILCSVIIRMISAKEAGIVLMLKTKAFRSLSIPLWAATKIHDELSPQIKRTLSKDWLLSVVNKVAVYRGFVDLPPKNGKGFLRLRKFV